MPNSAFIPIKILPITGKKRAKHGLQIASKVTNENQIYKFQFLNQFLSSICILFNLKQLIREAFEHYLLNLYKAN